MAMDRLEERWVHRFEIKPGRWVFHPTIATKEKGRRLIDKLLRAAKFPNNYWHLRKGGHVEALLTHTDNHFFFKLDLADFFGSINRSRVTRILKPYFGYQEARQAAIESTVRHTIDHRFMLPYGFVQSPLLASLALRDSALGTCLELLEREYGCTVSVYVDDIVISAQELITLKQVAEQVLKSEARSRFQINHHKTQWPSDRITVINIEFSLHYLIIP